MSIITKMRKQTAIWWAKTGTDRFGKAQFDTPVEVDCRWDDSSQEYRTAKGDMALSNAVVYVDRDMSIGDRLKFGSMDSNTNDDPMEEEDTYEIQRFDKNPNFKATEFLRTCFL